MTVLTHFPILKALGWALFNSLWQMAALWLVYTVLLAVFHRTAAAIRHGLALFLLCAGTVWTIANFCMAWLSPETGSSIWLPFFSTGAGTGFWQAGRDLVERILPSCSALYLLFLAGFLVRHATQYRQSRRLTRQGRSAMPPELRTFVTSTALQLGIGKPVQAWLSSLTDVPLTLGFLKPIILLPVSMITRLTPVQIEAILVHELAHIQRNDYLLHLVVTILEGLFFFNPFARLLIRQLKKERENCCDDMVLQFKYDAHAYVSALLTLAALPRRVNELAVAATGTGERLLLQRAKRILLRQKGERTRPAIRPLLLLLFAALAGGLAFHHPLLKARKTVAGPVARTYTIYFIRPETPLVRTRLSAIPAASQREFASLRPMAVQPAGPHAPAIVRMVRPGHPTHEAVPRALGPIPDGDDVVFINNSDEAVGLTYGIPGAAVLASDQEPIAANSPAPDHRDYSLNMPATVSVTAGDDQQGTPFVPNSSFSFQYNVGDSSHPEAQLIYLQQSAQLEVLAAIAKLQQQTSAQMQALNQLRTKASESVRLRRQIGAEQLQLQQNYLKKVETWQKRLQKTVHIKMIVYI